MPQPDDLDLNDGLKPYQIEFLTFALQVGALQLGEFILKSGRCSPYFFNSGLFNTGARLARLGRFYAQAIVDAGLEYDMIFGPAYKGIPLVSAVAIALADHHQTEVPYAFNRKEIKDHGEGGSVVGAPLAGRVLIIDDVISAGTSVRESLHLIHAAQAIPVGVSISLDREERGTGALSAVQELTQQHQLPVISIVTLTHLIAYFRRYPAVLPVPDLLAAIQAYQTLYRPHSR